MAVLPSMVLLLGATAFVVGAFTVVMVFRSRVVKAREAGYPSLMAYLRAAPRTDAERRDAVDLALKGLVLCLLGLLFPPFLLFGLIPFFYGARKVIYASMGLGLADDTDQPGR